MIFVDTGAFLANFLERDQHHDSARDAWEQLSRSGDRLLTSNFVLDETITLLGRRTSHAYAAHRARELLSSSHLRILRPSSEAEWEALERFEKLADQRVSFTDCISFALMRRERIRRAFTFDRHFRLAGFESWPDQL